MKSRKPFCWRPDAPKTLLLCLSLLEFNLRSKPVHRRIRAKRLLLQWWSEGYRGLGYVEAMHDRGLGYDGETT